MSRLGCVRYAPKVGRRVGLEERRGDHQRERLAVMADMRAGESWTGAPVRRRVRLITGALSRGVLMRDDGMDPWRPFRISCVNLPDTAVPDRRRNNYAVKRRLVFPVLIRVGCSAGDLHR